MAHHPEAVAGIAAVFPQKIDAPVVLLQGDPGGKPAVFHISRVFFHADFGGRAVRGQFKPRALLEGSPVMPQGDPDDSLRRGEHLCPQHRGLGIPPAGDVFGGDQQLQGLSHLFRPHCFAGIEGLEFLLDHPMSVFKLHRKIASLLCFSQYTKFSGNLQWVQAFTGLIQARLPEASMTSQRTK